MKERFILTVVVCFVLLFVGQISYSESVFLVLEKESRIEMDADKAKIILAIENPEQAFSATLKLRVLTPKDSVSFNTEFTNKIKSGKQTLEIPFELDEEARKDSALLWYRLKYEIISSDGAKLKTNGIISFSELFPEVFGLKLISTEGIKEKSEFRFRVQAVNPTNQKGVKDVEIETEFKIEDKEMETITAKAVTDADGFALLEFKTPAIGINVDSELKITGRKNGLVRTFDERLESLALRQVNIQTDQPDQTVAPNIKQQAKIYLADGYKRLLNYQTETGFGYWNGAEPDIALTAYVLRFLHDAEDFIKVDKAVVEKAESWLLQQQNEDGSWEDGKDTAVTTVYVARSLSLTLGKNDAKRKALESAVGFLKKRLPEINDAYVLANLSLIALEIDDLEAAKTVVAKLIDNVESFWEMKNTPFNGWGKAAKIETTALVVQTLLKVKSKKAKGKSEIEEKGVEKLINESIAFLLENKDQYGVWYSTQTTVNVLDTLILIEKEKIERAITANEKVSVFVNGKKVRDYALDEQSLSNPFVLDISTELNETSNAIEIKGLESSTLAFAQVVSKHYVGWSKTANADKDYFDLQVGFSKTQAKIGEDITCEVNFTSKTKRRGMILMEIGLPPGADVDRISLEKTMAEGNLSRYDILPDKVVFYSWSSASLQKFNFKFKPRFALDAQSSPSVIYDYYNSEAKATLSPMRFLVK